MAHRITDANKNVIKVAGSSGELDINTIISNLQKQIDNLESKLSKRYLIDAQVSGTTWYNLYSDGWKECGGYSTGGTVNFPIQFSNTNYTLVGGLIQGTVSATWEHLNMGSQTTTGFFYDRYDNYNLKWYACGY